jgi:hypothetical protein
MFVGDRYNPRNCVFVHWNHSLWLYTCSLLLFIVIVHCSYILLFWQYLFCFVLVLRAQRMTPLFESMYQFKTRIEQFTVETCYFADTNACCLLYWCKWSQFCPDIYYIYHRHLSVHGYVIRYITCYLTRHIVSKRHHFSPITNRKNIFVCQDGTIL